MLYAIPYFQQPYSDKKSATERTINNIKYIVHRPNHGVAHSLRQGFLVRDIVNLLYKNNKWLQNEISADRHFIIKLAILASFQRSGRQSEVSSSENPILYKKYENQDRINMIKSVDTKYFSSKNEIIFWSHALIWNTSIRCSKIINISKLIKAAHLLDLRRIPHFDKNRIKKEIADMLNIGLNSYIMDRLWEQSGKYLYISGDRDLVNQKEHWSNRFYILHHNPKTLYYKLRQHRLI